MSDWDDLELQEFLENMGYTVKFAEGMLDGKLPAMLITITRPNGKTVEIWTKRTEEAQARQLMQFIKAEKLTLPSREPEPEPAPAPAPEPEPEAPPTPRPPKVSDKGSTKSKSAKRNRVNKPATAEMKKQQGRGRPPGKADALRKKFTMENAIQYLLDNQMFVQKRVDPETNKKFIFVEDPEGGRHEFYYKNERDFGRRFKDVLLKVKLKVTSKWLDDMGMDVDDPDRMDLQITETESGVDRVEAGPSQIKATIDVDVADKGEEERTAVTPSTPEATGIPADVVERAKDLIQMPNLPDVPEGLPGGFVADTNTDENAPPAIHMPPKQEYAENLQGVVVAPVNTQEQAVDTSTDYQSDQPRLENGSEGGVQAQVAPPDLQSMNGGNALPPQLHIQIPAIAPYFAHVGQPAPPPQSIYTGPYYPAGDVTEPFHNAQVVASQPQFSGQQQQHAENYSEEVTMASAGIDTQAVSAGIEAIASTPGMSPEQIQEAQEQFVQGVAVVTAGTGQPLTPAEIQSIAGATVQTAVEAQNAPIAQQNARKIDQAQFMSATLNGEEPPPNGQPFNATDMLLAKMLRVLTIANKDKLRQQDLADNEFSPRANKVKVNLPPRPVATGNLPNRPWTGGVKVLTPKWA